MSLYEGVAFRGTFRSYQQRVLDNAKQYIAEGKLNIVAPPGSGNTILGLELIRGIGEACLIISPTVATRDYWGKQFREYFLEDESAFHTFFSTDLDRAKVINALTYAELEECMESYASDGEKKTVKLRRMIRERRIRTICLDEPHHLKSECLVALGKMQEVLEKDVKIISLSTTPPCAYEEAEQKHFFEVCGKVDTRILAWELVAEKVLCPHQDYMYFNMPSEEERALLEKHLERVQLALTELGQLGCVQASVKTANRRKSRWSYAYNQQYDTIKSQAPEVYIPILQLLRYYGMKIKRSYAKSLTGQKELPPIQMKDIQTALQYLIDYDDILMKHKESFLQVFRKYDLYRNEKVQLVPEELMHQVFAASGEKLQSIHRLVSEEYQNLGNDLRLFVFTEEMQEPIFEALRQLEIKIGVFTENLQILPMFEELQGTMMRMDPLGDTGYAKVEFFGGMQDAVDLVREMFREGKIQVLIGNETLLKEDWKENPINSLILPGFSKDFTRPHIMRGIALHAEKDYPEKCVNIWHLTTLLPEDMVYNIESPTEKPANELQSSLLGAYDFEMVRNRFQLFMEPDYETSGPERAIIRIVLCGSAFKRMELPPVNRQMLQFAADRDKTCKLWEERIYWLENILGKQH